MSAKGRFLPVAILSSDRPLVGESGHWDASSKSHVYDIRECQQRVESRRSDQSAFLKGARTRVTL
jgi:hypothetical protein